MLRNKRSRLAAFLLTSTALKLCSGCVIEGLKAELISRNSTVIRWESSGCPEKFDVTVQHKAYLACRKGSGVLQDDVTYTYKNHKFATINGLQPFSDYEIVVSATKTTSEKLRVSTRAAEPLNKPQPNPALNITSQRTSIHFYWKPPDTSSNACQNIRGSKNGYRVELYGIDPWVKNIQPVQTAKVENGGDFWVAYSLLPNTWYKLRVFTMNEKEGCNLTSERSATTTPCGLYNEGMPYELMGRTLPSVANPPTEVEATPTSSTQVNLRWVPAYPPTGKLAYYDIRWSKRPQSQNDVPKWVPKFQVSPDENTCKGDMDIAFRDPFCYQINNLEPNSSYIFEVRTVNVCDCDEQFTDPSDYSRRANATTDHASEPQRITKPTTTTTTATPSRNPKTLGPQDETTSPGNIQQESGMSVWSAILIAAVILLLLIIMAICYTSRDKIREAARDLIAEGKGRPSPTRRPGPAADHNGASGEFGACYFSQRDPNSEVVFLERTAVSHLTTLQKRRLPEPPPFDSPAGRPPTLNGGEEEHPYAQPMSVGPPSPPKQRASQLSEHQYIVPTDNSDVEEDGDYGEKGDYLKPTFVRQSSSQPNSLQVMGDTNSQNNIPMQSYMQLKPPQTNHHKDSDPSETPILAGAPVIV